MCRAADLYKEAFPHVNFNIPKVAAMGDSRHGIEEVGSMELISTDFGERSHRDIKPAVPFTNHHRDDESRQVLAHLGRLLCSLQLVAATQQPAEQLRAEQQARVRHRHL